MKNSNDTFPVKAHLLRQRQCGRSVTQARYRRTTHETNSSALWVSLMCNSSVCVFWEREGEQIFNPEVGNVGIVSSGSKEKKKLPAELLKAWGDISRTKRVPAEKCHPDLLPLRGCLSANPPTMHLDAHKHIQINTDYWTQKYSNPLPAVDESCVTNGWCLPCVQVLTPVVVEGKSWKIKLFHPRTITHISTL